MGNQHIDHYFSLLAAKKTVFQYMQDIAKKVLDPELFFPTQSSFSL
jgi:hypothetical protein